MFNVRLSKNIKIWTFEKASESSHFRSDNQRQISLVSNSTCRIRKRLISLTNCANSFKIMSFAYCEYSRYVSSDLEDTFFDWDVALIEERYCDNQREMLW
jgi:hypothetical protein